MKFLLCRGLTLWVLLGCLAPALWSQPAARISKIVIRHIGPPAVSDELVKANIRIKEGDSYSKLNIDSDVRNLYGTGYFYNIRVGEETTPDGVVLTYVVQGKPILTSIKFQGNKKYSTSKLFKKVTSKTGEPLDERKLFADSQEILKMYQKAGYQKTQVKAGPPVIDENAGRGTVTFEIIESPKVKIRNVIFENATAFKQRKLRKVIKTRRYWMFSWLTGSGKLKDEEFEEDKEKLADFYRNEGYIDFELKEVKFDQVSPKRMDIRFTISEGKRYKVGAVELKGNKLFATPDILSGLRTREGEKFKRGLNLNVGQTFTPKGLAKDREAIEDYYGTRGYIDARVAPIKNPNIETGTMDLVYQIEEGDKSYIEKIEIKGNTKTKDRVIRRELAVAPGEVFDMVRVKISTNRLAGLNYFEKIEARPEETEIPNRRNLTIAVDEKNTGNFTLGAGFSTVDNVVGFVEVSQGNFDLFNPPHFTGGGQKFRLRTQVGTRRQDYLISFIEPWFLGRQLSLGVELYHRDLSFLSSLYDLRRTGASLSLRKALPFNFEAGISYTLESVGLLHMPSPYNVTDANGVTTLYDPVSPELRLEEGNRLVSKVGTSLAYDTRNSALLPSKGQRTELVTELAGLGGDTDKTSYYKVELRSAHYIKGFLEGHILELAGRVGVVKDYGDTVRVPLFERWFLGGLYSLRGYDYRKVGPRDAYNEPIGGNTSWFGSAEYSVPIIDRLRFALFYDIGMVYRDAYSFDEKNTGTGLYNDNWGVGIRLNLPIGPLRLDYGIPITHDRFNSGSGKFQFGVGYTREF